MWESNPDRFWSQVVETVRMSHASDGTRFATAIWPGHEQTFVLNEVAPLLARYFQL